MEKQKIVSTIANNVRGLINQKGISIHALAKKSTLSAGSISKIINGTMSITVPTLMSLAHGLEVSIDDILEGLAEKNIKRAKTDTKLNKKDLLYVGVLSINNKRMTCVKDYSGKIIGTSELAGGLDLAETMPSVLELMQQSIREALSDKVSYRHVCLTSVVQSYEFEETRKKFELFAEKHFYSIYLLPDWQITYLATYNETSKVSSGISLVVDKGVSLSYMHNGDLKKLGGWKFPVYDLGGENWLGSMAIKHTIDAFEGYIPMTGLARSILAKFNGKIEKITETCFKGARDPDIYCLFCDILLRCYYTGDKSAKDVIEQGFKIIYRSIQRADSILGKQQKIAINGSLTDIYKPFFPQERLVPSPNDFKKVELLADIYKEKFN